MADLSDLRKNVAGLRLDAQKEEELLAEADDLLDDINSGCTDDSVTKRKVWKIGEILGYGENIAACSTYVLQLWAHLYMG